MKIMQLLLAIPLVFSSVVIQAMVRPETTVQEMENASVAKSEFHNCILHYSGCKECSRKVVMTMLALYGAGDAEKFSAFQEIYLDLHAIDGAGRNTFRYAVASRKSNLKLLKKLIDAGVDPNQEDRLGESPLMSALRFWPHEDNVAYALQAGASVTRVCGNGESVVTWWLKEGDRDRLAITRLLLTACARETNPCSLL
jgi:hypothetical protein